MPEHREAHWRRGRLSEAEMAAYIEARVGRSVKHVWFLGGISAFYLMLRAQEARRG